MTDVTDVVSVVTESVLLPSGGTVLGGEPGQRRCKRPGCGNPVPVPGRGRARVFCGDACSRRFRNAARSAGGDAGAVSPGQAADPPGALEALIRPAGSVVTLARGQVAALDPEVVTARLAEAEAARRRAEARAVTAEARAAEAEQELLAALEAAQTAHRGQEAAEAEARRGREETAQARRELAEEAARARADAEAALARAGRWPPRPPGSPRPHGPNAIRPVSRPRRRFVLPRLSWLAPGRGKPAPGSRPGRPARTRPGSGRLWMGSTRPGCRQPGSSPQPGVTARCEPSSAWTPSASAMTACSRSLPQPATRMHAPLRAILPGLGSGGPVPAAQPGPRHERREGARAALRRCAHRAVFDTGTAKSPARRPART
jgi:hypothetical protein